MMEFWNVEKTKFGSYYKLGLILVTIKTEIMY